MKKLLTACLLTTALCGAETLFETNGENNDDFISATATQANLTGDTP